MKHFFLSLLFGLGITGRGSAHGAEDPRLKEIMNPHQMPSQGPFFEGWYHRVVDRKNGLSIAAIATAYKPLNGTCKDLLTEKNPLHAYIGIFISQEGQRPRLIELKDTPASLITTDEGYQIEIPGIGFVSHENLELAIGDQKIQMNWKASQRNAWPASYLTGLETPEDFAAMLKLFPLHWHVHDIGSSANYHLQIPDQEIKSDGDFHHEKNWGQLFPNHWYWLDAMDSQQGVFISGAGGSVDAGPLPARAFLLAIKTPEAEINFTPTHLGALYKIKTNNCNQFRISGFQNGYKFIIDASAEDSQFEKLSVPTKGGYLPGATETLQAKLRLRIWRLGPRSFLGLEKPISDYQLDHVGLEFGQLDCKH